MYRVGSHMQFDIPVSLFTCTSASGRDSNTIRRTPNGLDVFSKTRPSASWKQVRSAESSWINYQRKNNNNYGAPFDNR